MNILRRGMGVLLSCALLTSCAKQMPSYRTQGPAYTQRQLLIKQIKSHAGKLSIAFGQGYTVGQTVTLNLHSAFFFQPYSANLRQTALPVLSLVTRLIATYQTTSIRVSAYSSSVGNPVFLKALTTKQANVIAGALWQHHVNTRLISAVGYGDATPVASNHTAIGRELNNRVVVRFHFYPKHVQYN